MENNPTRGNANLIFLLHFSKLVVSEMQKIVKRAQAQAARKIKNCGNEKLTHSSHNKL